MPCRLREKVPDLPQLSGHVDPIAGRGGVINQQLLQIDRDDISAFEFQELASCHSTRWWDSVRTCRFQDYYILPWECGDPYALYPVE